MDLHPGGAGDGHLPLSGIAAVAAAVAAPGNVLRHGALDPL